jgi:tRNA(Ile)-lysidine synthase
LFLQEEIVLRVLRHLDIEPSTVKINNIIELGSKQSGHSVNLSGHHAVYKDRGHLVFCEEFQAEPFSTTVELGNTYTFDHFTFTLGQPGPRPSMYERDGRTEYVDCDMIKHPLTVRSWKPGDWFVPLGMNGKKKLSDFFNDIKAPYSEKMHTAVFESNEDIVWVCGKRLDSRYRITDSTRNTIRLTISPSNSPAN